MISTIKTTPSKIGDFAWLRQIFLPLWEFLLGWARHGIQGFVLLLIVWGGVATYLYYSQRAEAIQKNFNRQVNLAIDFLGKEGQTEEGPELIDALLGYKELFQKTVVVLEARQQSLPLTILRKKVNFERYLAEAKLEYATDPKGNQEVAGAAIKRASTALFGLSKSLMVSRSNGKLIAVRPADLVSELVASLHERAGKFDKAANELFTEKTFSKAEAACFESRFCAMNIVLGWPEIQQSPSGKEDIVNFRNKLLQVKAITSDLAVSWPNKTEASHLENYVKSQERRITVIDALLKSNLEEAENALLTDTH